MKKKVIVLGCTGSIGRNTLDVIEAMPERFEISALSAHSNEAELLNIARRHGVKNIALSGKKPENSSIKFSFPAGLSAMITETEADIVVNGLAGSDGLIPSIASLESGKNLALANKETIVMAGALVSDISSRKGAKIIPVDSEHSAIFNLIGRYGIGEIDEIIITASGGAFRDLTAEEMKNVSLEDALKHPNWSMGKKITIDSSSMANKGLEVIEAYQLFNLPLDRIKVLIHPQSMVHSLIRTAEGSLYAQISRPDMRIPIQNALTWPETGPSLFGRLELGGITLNFSEPDPEKYRMLSLAYQAAGCGQVSCIAYNAANEIAVDAFLKRLISFSVIPDIVESTLESSGGSNVNTIEEVLEADNLSRIKAHNYLRKISGEK